MAICYIYEYLQIQQSILEVGVTSISRFSAVANTRSSVIVAGMLHIRREVATW